MLKTIKMITLTGDSVVADDVILNFSADISTQTGGTSFLRQSILDHELYQANRKECRKDIADFQELIYKLEDEL